MKIREGFVSNSSSSSFLLCTKGSMKEASREAFSKAIGIEEGSIAEALCKPLIDHIFKAKSINLKAMLADYGYKTLEEALETEGKTSSINKVAKLLEEGWEVREIRGSNEGDTAADAYFYGFTPKGTTKNDDVKFIHLYP